MKKNRLFLIAAAAVFFMLSSTAIYAAPSVGSITFLEGTVDVYRNGKAVDWRLVTENYRVEAYDLIETGKDGYAEIEVTLNSGSKAKVNI